MAIEIPTSVLAAIEAERIASRINNVIADANTLLTEGVPARGNKPAISDDEIKTALGTDIVTKIQAAIAALA